MLRSPCDRRWRSALPGPQLRKLAVELRKTGLFESGCAFDAPIPDGVIPPELHEVALRRCRDCEALYELHEFTLRLGDTVQIVTGYDNAGGARVGQVGKLVGIDATTNPWRCTVKGRRWTALAQVKLVHGHGQTCLDCHREWMRVPRGAGHEARHETAKTNRAICGCGEVRRATTLRMVVGLGWCCPSDIKQHAPAPPPPAEEPRPPRYFHRSETNEAVERCRPSFVASDFDHLHPAILSF